ncbi:FRG domain-containing protein [Vibrio harveyi]|uniref:FRG domain-containing protein n=1 Tax=Vibrio harveyi TaxID=669 RepID=UPI002ECFEF73|nr:FRG domain-containing protein [Vibrio harveyi]
MFKLDQDKNIFVTKTPIQSVSDFTQTVDSLYHYLGNYHHWYRGVRVKTYKLEPSAVRHENWQYNVYRESAFIHDFIQRARGVVSSSYDDWSWLSVCQHYGLPTRLLDWSESALTSLFFAIEDDSSNHSPAVWILNPWRLNHYSVNREEVFSTDSMYKDESGTSITNLYKVGSDKLPKYPVAVKPPHIDKRISTQRGCFTIHGTVKDSFLELSKKVKKPFLARIDIDAESKLTLRRELHTLGVDSFSIYPDLEGLAKAIKWHYDKHVVYVEEVESET